MNTLNELGKACPLPVIETKKALEGLAPGESVCVLVDNEIATQNLHKLADQKGCTYACTQNAEREFAVTLTVAAAGLNPANAPIECEACTPAPAKSGTVVVVSAPVMGTGSDELGRALMKAFLFALTKQDSLPKAVVFYNGGAALTCEGSDSLEDLRLLADAGVEILTCGTCLNFYGLTEKLAVGTVTNMYSIVEVQMNAATVIRP